MQAYASAFEGSIDATGILAFEAMIPIDLINSPEHNRDGECDDGDPGYDRLIIPHQDHPHNRPHGLF